jgi:hypothetical protein
VRTANLEREDIMRTTLSPKGLILATAVIWPLAAAAAEPAVDTDHDGIPDTLDKCTLDSRNATAPATCDSDGDGYGNVCDPDFDQDFAVTETDYTMFFVPAFKGQDPAPWPQGMDMNCDGVVNATDYGMFFVPKFKGDAKLGGAKPGPSGLACAGKPGCK